MFQEDKGSKFRVIIREDNLVVYGVVTEEGVTSRYTDICHTHIRVMPSPYLERVALTQSDYLVCFSRGHPEDLQNNIVTLSRPNYFKYFDFLALLSDIVWEVDLAQFALSHTV